MATRSLLRVGVWASLGLAVGCGTKLGSVGSLPQDTEASSGAGDTDGSTSETGEATTAGGVTGGGTTGADDCNPECGGDGPVWSRVYELPVDVAWNAVSASPDGGFAVAVTLAFSVTDLRGLVMGFDAAGALQWEWDLTEDAPEHQPATIDHDAAGNVWLGMFSDTHNGLGMRSAEGSLTTLGDSRYVHLMAPEAQDGILALTLEGTDSPIHARLEHYFSNGGEPQIVFDLPAVHGVSDLAAAPDGGVVLGLLSDIDAPWTIQRLDPGGATVWTRELDYVMDPEDELLAVTVDPQGRTVFAAGGTDTYWSRLAGDGTPLPFPLYEVHGGLRATRLASDVDANVAMSLPAVDGSNLPDEVFWLRASDGRTVYEQRLPDEMEIHPHFMDVLTNGRMVVVGNPADQTAPGLWVAAYPAFDEIP